MTDGCGSLASEVLLNIGAPCRILLYCGTPRYPSQVGTYLLTLYYTWRPTTNATDTDSLMTAALIGSLYFFTALTAIFYPGSAGVDPEFEDEFAEGFVTFRPFLGFTVLPWVGYWLAKRRH